MALGALIGAYQEDDSGALRALLPLAGRSLLEYQVRCATASGAAPIVVLVERVPILLQDAFERLRQEGITVVPVSDGNEAASRFEAGSLILEIADGIAPDIGDIARLVELDQPAIATLPDDEAHEAYERIDSGSRWAGIALVEASTLGSTAAMLGDWDLQSTLLRRAVQSGARLIRLDGPGGGPLLAHSVEALSGFEKRLLLASRGARRDIPSRYLLPLIEEFATERLMETRVRPEWMVGAALTLTLAAAFAFTRGWLWPALGLLVLATPLDLVAARLGTLRLKPLSRRLWTRRALWPAAGLALVALGWFAYRHGEGGWGALVSALAAAGFGQAHRLELDGEEPAFRPWLFARRNAIFAALPLAAFGWWNALLVALACYAAGSFFLVQHFRHAIQRD
ncbi:MAG: hypothetical protein M3N02_03285, partial [Pseudomonadota bacterium]|nr:hypothetical protein [Pseudomonadota bacterium]